MSDPTWTQADVRACAAGLRDYIAEDGIPDIYPPKLRRACERGQWARAVFLEHSHMRRFMENSAKRISAKRMASRESGDL